MREIKFRAWDNIKKEMVTKFDNDTGFGIIEFGIDDNCQLFCQRYDLDENIYNLTVMQFTGLKDKSGNEIYEGDIVRKYIYSNKKAFFVGSVTAYPFEVKYIPCKFNIQAPTGDRKGVCYEVIGNVYENPELLKEDEE